MSSIMVPVPPAFVYSSQALMERSTPGLRLDPFQPEIHIAVVESRQLPMLLLEVSVLLSQIPPWTRTSKVRSVPTP